MNGSVLVFRESFTQELKSEAESILRTHLVIGEGFKSADSFSYLLLSDNEKYVGKIFRFEHWPPEGKLELTQKLLNDNGIPHEEIIYISYSHPIFKFGWQINKYIPGGSISEIRKQGNLAERDYYYKLGRVLRKIHTVRMEYFGFMESSTTYPSFKDFALKELHDHNYPDLPEEYQYAYGVISSAKKEVQANLDGLRPGHPVLVHDDANESNVMWNNGEPIIIDWTDSLAAPYEREFACLTFRQDTPVLEQIENGYGVAVNRKALRIHQIMRFIRLGQFYYLEDGDLDELKNMMERLKGLLTRSEPYGV